MIENVRILKILYEEIAKMHILLSFSGPKQVLCCFLFCEISNYLLHCIFLPVITGKTSIYCIDALWSVL